jgi:hypothetical protein
MREDASESRRTVLDNNCVYNLHVEYERVSDQSGYVPCCSLRESARLALEVEIAEDIDFYLIQ